MGVNPMKTVPDEEDQDHTALVAVPNKSKDSNGATHALIVPNVKSITVTTAKLDPLKQNRGSALRQVRDRRFENLIAFPQVL